MEKHMSFGALLFVIVSIFGLAGLAIAATTLSLGRATSFAILAGSGISNTGTSTILGDVGSSPTATQTGFGPGANQVNITGNNYPVGGQAVIDAITDLVTAYNVAAGQASTTAVTTNFINQTLTPGVYKDNGAPASLGITAGNVLILDGGGNPDAVFIFQSASTLVTGANSEVRLINGTQACNVFWQVGTSATLGTGTLFKGTILAKTSITDNGTSTVIGRLLAGESNDGNGHVTLNNTIVTNTLCNPKITVTKIVSGGTKVATDFPLFVDSSPVTTGVASTTSVGTHTISETLDSNYTSVIGGQCATNGSITLASGENKSCTITNTYITPASASGSSYSTGGSVHYGCKDTTASNYEYFASSDPSLCLYSKSIPTPYFPNTGVNDNEVITKSQTSTSTSSTFYRSLKLGSKGDDVVLLQGILEKKGFLIIPTGISRGFFGALTQSAVTKYQKSNSLPAVGIFGPMTRAKVISELGE